MAEDGEPTPEVEEKDPVPPAPETNVLKPGEEFGSALVIMPSYHQLSPDLDEDAKVQELPESQLQCFGYRTYLPKIILYYILNTLLLGTPYLYGRWYSKWKVLFKCTPIALSRASVVLLKDSEGNYFKCNVVEEPVQVKLNEISQIDGAFLSRSTCKKNLDSLLHSFPVLRNFTFHHEKYIWDDRQKQFRRIEGLDGYTCNELVRSFPGHTPTRLEHMRKVFGTNLIDVVVKSYWKLAIDEVLNPFYLFQAFSVTLWTFDDYYIYAVCVVIISTISISFSLFETRRQQLKIQEMAEGERDKMIQVRRNGGEETEVSSKELVPGDIILIPPHGYTMDCDAVLMTGSCIVNESMLTGESIPVNKVALVPSTEIYDSDTFKRNTLFAGTKVIQTRFYGGKRITCLVVRTGFNTQKGQLIRSILFPKEVGLNFYNDAMKFVKFLFIVASFGMAWSIYLYIHRGASVRTIIVRVLDIVTIVVPPALPAAMTVGIVYAQSRLKKKDIFCISPLRINFCGQLTLVCFDKTGTLTEEGLDLWCVVPCEEKTTTFQDAIADPSILSNESHLLRAMASCHALTHIDREIVGDPLDLKMFNSTKWNLLEPEGQEETRRFDLLAPNVVSRGDTELGIIREFEFTPQLQRMSVVVKIVEPSGTFLYCKGSPEKVSRLCRALPNDYDRVLDSFTVKGYRVIAIAWKPISHMSWHHAQRISREDMESDLIFGGFLVMQNSLKDATIPVIEELSNANIRSVMVTGDHLLTAISVARECGMIPSCDKVVVVHADDDGEVTFKLAAHHYETLEPEEEPETIRDNHVIQEMPHVLDDIQLMNHTDGVEVGIRPRMRGRSLSIQSGGGDALIDMERLVPIARPNNIAQTIIDLHESNYHFVLTGKTWDNLKEKCPKDLMDKILAKGTVFARMSPESKREVVEHFQGLGYIVSMCGDGANDCSALKMAHVGISLSKAEASVAAPFTSSVEDVSCVPKLIMEGRCALVTSFGMFKYMALYSLIQFTSVLLLYLNFTNFHDTHFLYIDLGITTTIALVLGRTEPFQKIVAKPPTGQLVSIQNICSILAQVILAVSVQIVAVYWLQEQNWYSPIAQKMTDPDDIIKRCWETTTVLSVSAFQYIIICVIFCIGPPYRKPFYTNRFLLWALIILTSFTIFLTVYPVGFLADFFQLMDVDGSNIKYRVTLLLFPLVNLVIAYGLETNISNRHGFVGQLNRIFGIQRKKKVYEETLENLAKDTSWPPITP